ncbi:hypothetical protein ES703_61208 [subsurface metagenome]
MPNAVLVIDMVRGFFEEGNPLYLGERARRIIPNIQRLLEQEIEKGSRVFFLCDHHTPDDPEFAMFPVSPSLYLGNRRGRGHPRARQFFEKSWRCYSQETLQLLLRNRPGGKAKCICPREADSLWRGHRYLCPSYGI